MKENEVKIDYCDIQAFIEVIIDRGQADDFPIATVDDLFEYMDDNPAEPFSVITRRGGRQ